MTVNHWTEKAYYSFDIESTSGNPLEAHVVTATMVKLVDGEYADERAWVISPEVDIPAEATEIHGITTEWARENGRDPREALEEILTMVAQLLKGRFPLVIFNAAYDLSLLEAQARHFGLKTLQERVPLEDWVTVIDPFVMAKGLEHFLKREFVKGRTFKLPDVCERYGIEFEESHDATADAIGAGQLAAVLIHEHESLSEKGPMALTNLQEQWRRRMQRSLREYFDKNNIEHDGVDDGWPLHNSLVIA